jgi:hypothetical protein
MTMSYDSFWFVTLTLIFLFVVAHPGNAHQRLVMPLVVFRPVTADGAILFTGPPAMHMRHHAVSQRLVRQEVISGILLYLINQ